MAEDDFGTLNVFGVIIIFSFVSLIIFFVSMLVLGGLNNYVLQKLLVVLNDLVSSGVVESTIGGVGDTLTGLAGFVPYLDVLWFISFLTLVIGSVYYSYNAVRMNYFSLFSFSVFGIIVLTYVGGLILQLTNWFRTEVLLRVFPNLLDSAPFFTYYLDNMAVINLILIVVCVIANFVELDFSRFNRPKSGDEIGEL